MEAFAPLRKLTVSAALLAALLPVKGWAVNSEIDGFRLATCSAQGPRKCIKVESTIAEGSSFAKIFSLKDVNVVLFNNDKKIESLHAKSGYFDAEMQRVVLFESFEGQSRERVVNFKDYLDDTTGGHR